MRWAAVLVIVGIMVEMSHFAEEIPVGVTMMLLVAVGVIMVVLKRLHWFGLLANFAVVMAKVIVVGSIEEMPILVELTKVAEEIMIWLVA